MNNYKSFFFGIILFSFFSMNAQKLTPKQQEREDNKVQIYSPKEKDNLQRIFHEGVAEMKLDQKIEEEYFSIVLYYTSKMSNLNDKDKGNSPTEIKTKVIEYVDKINSEVLLILNEEQYKIHIENFGKIIHSLSVRLEKS
jgi:hypothetical protein